MKQYLGVYIVGIVVVVVVVVAMTPLPATMERSSPRRHVSDRAAGAYVALTYPSLRGAG